MLRVKLKTTILQSFQYSMKVLQMDFIWFSWTRDVINTDAAAWKVLKDIFNSALEGWHSTTHSSSQALVLVVDLQMSVNCVYIFYFLALSSHSWYAWEFFPQKMYSVVPPEFVWDIALGLIRKFVDGDRIVPTNPQIPICFNNRKCWWCPVGMLYFLNSIICYHFFQSPFILGPNMQRVLPVLWPTQGSHHSLAMTLGFL